MASSRDDAAYQENRYALENLSTTEFDRVFESNIYATLWIARAGIPHLAPASANISTTSVQASSPSPGLIDYAMTKAALVVFSCVLPRQCLSTGSDLDAGDTRDVLAR